MKRLLICSFLLLLTGCTCTAPPAVLPQQDIEQLYPYDVMMQRDMPETAYPDAVKAFWIPFMLIDAWMDGSDEDTFRSQVRDTFAACSSLGLNTVYLHVRAYADAYYRSGIFRQHMGQDYDPLEIMIQEARAVGLSPHAWINPLRAGTDRIFAETESACTLRKWYDSSEKNGTYLVQTNGSYYLNPAYQAVRTLVADGAVEIIRGYDIDGIHIDDYFYPTTDESFDAQAFAESGCADLAEWRRSNCSLLVRSLYEAVKAENPSVIFSISPQGNPAVNHDTLYADTLLWCSEPGYCDVMIPQIYYGFCNESCPFSETLSVWKDACTAADLVVGLAAYKSGQEDSWAGTGHAEWVNDSTVLLREAQEALTETDGISLYSCSYLLDPANSEEISGLKALLCGSEV